MTTLELTREEILDDIKGYQERICKAQEKLSELPAKGKTGKQTWKINNTRRKLLQEIEHVERLKSWAQEALNE